MRPFFIRRLMPVLYRIGTAKELASVKGRVPKQVYEDLTIGVVVLDEEYGKNRDYLQEGGYSLIAETADDLAEVRAAVDYERHPAEWVVRESRNCGYLCCLFIMNDDFSIMLYLPEAVAPDAILKDLEV